MVAAAAELAGTRAEDDDEESRLAFFCGVGLTGVAFAGVLVLLLLLVVVVVLEVVDSSSCGGMVAFFAGVLGIGGTGGAGSKSATD